MKIKKMAVRLTLTQPMLGTVAKDQKVHTTFVVERKLALAGASRQEIAAKSEEEGATVPDLEERGWTGFHQDEKGLFIYDYMIRGFLKNAARALKDQAGLKNVKSKIDTFVFVAPRKIYLMRGGKHITAPEGTVERPLRAETMRGPRVTLVKSDQINEGATLQFGLEIIENSKEFTPKVIGDLFEYGRYQGLGQWRNASYGRFDTEIKEIGKTKIG